MIWIEPSAVEAIQGHALAAYPDECCGALLGTVSAEDQTVRWIAAVVPLDNEARSERATRFVISSLAVKRCEQIAALAGSDIIGFYHSHPDCPPTPSHIDRALGWPWYVFMIASVYGHGAGPMRAWMLANDGTSFSEIEFAVAEPVR